MMDEEDELLRLARLSVDDLSDIALQWRLRALRGDPTTTAIAEALESVVRQRRADILARARVLAAKNALASFRKAAVWAVSRR